LKQSEGEALVICPVCGKIFYTKVPDTTSDCYWFSLTPSEVCYILLCLKAVRLRCAPDPWDSCVDLVNYATLYLALLEEEGDEGEGE